MGILIDRFDEHEGPVRGVSFHCNQPLFVSGGDDYKVRVWNYKQRRCLFVLHGHLDYIRTVSFHGEAPWILSCSDDQTIRIWNWQSRTCISVLTGHSHYVMCAQFHPKEPLIVSGSLDFTVRVWDISGLRKKNAAPGTVSQEEIKPLATDLFGNSDAMVKYVLEGHDKGVNWVAFHPTLPLILSAGDDRQIKLWRFSETKAWEVDTFRGHFNNVSCVLFHPHSELVLSNSEDKTIRVWDLNKRTLLQTFRREQDRLWVMIAHPHLQLFAAGHDSGMIVFKLERERPAFTLFHSMLVYIHQKTIQAKDLATLEEQTLGTLVSTNGLFTPPRTLDYHPAERLALVQSSGTEGGFLECYTLDRAVEPMKFQGQAGFFVSKDRIAILNKSTQEINVYDLYGTKLKDIFLTSHPSSSISTSSILDMFPAGVGCVLLSTSSSVEIWNVLSDENQILYQLPHVSNVKYVVWSADHSLVALLSKHVITICQANLEPLCTLHETIRIKSACFDRDVLVYTTLNHIKFSLSNGDNGILCTLENPVYLVQVNKDDVIALTRDTSLVRIPVSTTEYRFKHALVNREYDKVLSIIHHENLMGQSIIAYLQKKGYSDVALHFVQDPPTRFELALESGQLEGAYEAAKKMDQPTAWTRFAKASLLQGNITMAELAYQQVKDMHGLGLLYFLTGQTENQEKMVRVAHHRQEVMLGWILATYLGSIKDQLQCLESANQSALAWLFCESHGLKEKAKEFLPSDVQVTLPKAWKENSPRLLIPSRPVSTMASPWPLKAIHQGYFTSSSALSASEPSQSSAN
ncbi:hypothetical protein HMI54_012895 [Coelomomyces lativittatus]|nr:hypothetical protein HMI54_012895 [Coelomomyces lativittatus]